MLRCISTETVTIVYKIFGKLGVEPSNYEISRNKVNGMFLYIYHFLLHSIRIMVSGFNEQYAHNKS